VVHRAQSALKRTAPRQHRLGAFSFLTKSRSKRHSERSEEPAFPRNQQENRSFVAIAPQDDALSKVFQLSPDQLGKLTSPALRSSDRRKRPTTRLLLRPPASTDTNTTLHHVERDDQAALYSVCPEKNLCLTRRGLFICPTLAFFAISCAGLRCVLRGS
jgi:hypothetical protein